MMNVTKRSAVSAIEDCIRAIASWMTQDKAEVVLIGTRQQLAEVRLSHIQVENVEVSHVSKTRSLAQLKPRNEFLYNETL